MSPMLCAKFDGKLLTTSKVIVKNFWLTLLCSKCSTDVKIILCKVYCVSLYDACLWFQYSAVVLNKLRSCYHKCLKFFFGFKRHNSVTLILLHLGLPSFNTIMHNSSVIWVQSWRDNSTVNEIVIYFNDILPNGETR